MICLEGTGAISHVSGASLFVPFRLEPGEKRTIRLRFCWFVPETGFGMAGLKRGIPFLEIRMGKIDIGQ